MGALSRQRNQIRPCFNFSEWRLGGNGGRGDARNEPGSGAAVAPSRSTDRRKGAGSIALSLSPPWPLEADARHLRKVLCNAPAGFWAGQSPSLHGRRGDLLNYRVRTPCWVPKQTGPDGSPAPCPRGEAASAPRRRWGGTAGRKMMSSVLRREGSRRAGRSDAAGGDWM